VFPWALFRRTRAAIKLHTLLDLRGNISAFIRIGDGTMHDVNVLDELIAEPGAFDILDRAYVDFYRLHDLHANQAFFVTRAKVNMAYRRCYSHPVDTATGLRSDQTIVLTTENSLRGCPDPLRRIRFYDEEKERAFVFLTNKFSLPARTITELYKYRWQVELFFKWIKQHLRIKKFFGTTENTVRTPIWIAISVHVLIAIMKKRLALPMSLYTILQVFSVTLFEKAPIFQVLSEAGIAENEGDEDNQLFLFD